MADFSAWFSILLALLGVGFFLAGSVGLIRLPDVYSRLHALTKADNLGLGLVMVAVMLRQDDWVSLLKLIMIWVLVLVTSASVAMLTARTAHRSGVALNGKVK
jgi:multicomponent Na+:H+ antiporter subunit G